MQAKEINTGNESRCKSPYKPTQINLIPGPPSIEDIGDGSKVRRDEQGRISTITDAIGNSTHFSYDRQGNLNRYAARMPE